MSFKFLILATTIFLHLEIQPLTSGLLFNQSKYLINLLLPEWVQPNCASLPCLLPLIFMVLLLPTMMQPSLLTCSLSALFNISYPPDLILSLSWIIWVSSCNLPLLFIHNSQTYSSLLVLYKKILEFFFDLVIYLSPIFMMLIGWWFLWLLIHIWLVSFGATLVSVCQEVANCLLFYWSRISHLLPLKPISTGFANYSMIKMFTEKAPLFCDVAMHMLHVWQAIPDSMLEQSTLKLTHFVQEGCSQIYYCLFCLLQRSSGWFVH